MEAEKVASCSMNEFKELHDLKDVKVKRMQESWFSCIM